MRTVHTSSRNFLCLASLFDMCISFLAIRGVFCRLCVCVCFFRLVHTYACDAWRQNVKNVNKEK